MIFKEEDDGLARERVTEEEEERVSVFGESTEIISEIARFSSSKNLDNGGGDGIGCFEIKIGADTAKFTNVRIAGFGYCRYFIRENEMFVKDKT